MAIFFPHDAFRAAAAADLPTALRPSPMGVWPIRPQPPVSLRPTMCWRLDARGRPVCDWRLRPRPQSPH
jgi:hypothetical protein